MEERLKARYAIRLIVIYSIYSYYSHGLHKIVYLVVQALFYI